MNAEFVTQQSAMTSLYRRWLSFLLAGLAFLVIGFLTLKVYWAAGYAMRWLLLTGMILSYQIWLLRKNLSYNHRIGEQTLLPVLGIGNSITLFRGVLFAGLTGFLLAPRPLAGLAWIPALLYTTGALIDFLDGYAARATNQVTKLGEILDMSMDGWGILVASFLAVLYEQVPTWYILVGLARYLYLSGLWLWKRGGKKIYDLPPSRARRPFAGLQMGFAFVMLWPIFRPPGTHTAAVIFAVPFLVAFAWDWLVVSGTVAWDAIKPWRWVKDFFTRWLPLALRIGVVVLMAWQYRQYVMVAPQALRPVFIVFDFVIPLFLLFGAAGRVMAIGGLVMLGFHQMFAPLNQIQFGLIWVYGMLLYLGTGVFSTWKPEDRLIFRRAGD